MIAVTGATGALGRRVVDRLAAAGDVPLRLVVRDSARAPQVPGAEVVANPGGFDDPAGLEAALRGADTVYLVSAAEHENRLEQHFAAVDAAVAAGVQRIVYTSFLNASPDAVFTLVRQHAATEDRIRQSGVRAHLPAALDVRRLRAVLRLDRGRGGRDRGTGRERRTSFVSRDDLADVAAAVLLREDTDLDGQALAVTGPEALTMTEAAEVLTEITGRPVSYRDQTVEEAWATRRPSGHPDWEIEGWVTSYLAIAAGELATVTDVVPTLTGHPARTVAEHLRAHPEDWANLR